jgi:hypothetical protein
MGKAKCGVPIENLLLDEVDDRLQSELDEFPDCLFCLQRDGEEKGTLLQIAIRRGQASVVAVIVNKLLELFEKAKVSGRDSFSDFVQCIDGQIKPRLLSEDPVGVGPLSELMRPLDPGQRRSVALVLLPYCTYFSCSEERALIGIYADSPDVALSQETSWSPIYQLLVSKEFSASKCYERVCQSLGGGLDEINLLHEAARRGFTNALRLLVDEGYDPNQRDSKGCTPLHVAAEAGHIMSLETLLQLGSNPLAEDLQGDVALISALNSGSNDCAFQLIKYLDEISSGITEKALSIAIHKDMFELASRLLKLDHGNTHPNPNEQERLFTDLDLSKEACRWLFALLATILLYTAQNGSEIMPLLTPEDFQYASQLIGLDCNSADKAIEEFLNTISSKVSLREGLHKADTVYGAPVCLLFCASSLGIAITKENSSFHQLHPQMRSLFGQAYEDSHLGEAWENLRLWMESFGLVLAWPQDTWLRNVGPPLYHAIWRPDDREKLFEALGSLGVNTLSPITTAEMEVFLRRKIDMFSARIKNMLSSDTDREAVLRSACSNLSVSCITRSSRVRSVRSSDSWWAILSWRRDLRTKRILLQATLPCSEGMPDSISFEDGKEYLSNGETYQRVTLDASWIDKGKIISREGYTFRVPSIEEPLIFSVSGDRFQRYSLTIGEGHMIICPLLYKDSISEFLKEVQDDEVKESRIEHFPELVALGPIAPLREVSGPLKITERQKVHGDLVDGLRFRGNEYHHLALPYVLQGFVAGEECSWIVDGVEIPADLFIDEDGQVLVKPPVGGTSYCLKIAGKKVNGTCFEAVQSVAKLRQDEPRTRWPLLLPDKGEFTIIGVSGTDIAKVTLTRKSGLLTVPFEPCWAVDEKARPLVAVIEHPDEIPFSPTLVDSLKNVFQASAGDAMSRSVAQQYWGLFQGKALRRC